MLSKISQNVSIKIHLAKELDQRWLYECAVFKFQTGKVDKWICKRLNELLQSNTVVNSIRMRSHVPPCSCGPVCLQLCLSRPAARCRKRGSLYVSNIRRPVPAVNAYVWTTWCSVSPIRLLGAFCGQTIHPRPISAAEMSERVNRKLRCVLRTRWYNF